MPNAELAYRVLDQIDAEPERWNQNAWVIGCGTSYCFAGWALTLTGHTLVGRGAEAGSGMDLDGFHRVDGSIVGDAAARELDIDLLSADDLFSVYNNRADLGTLVAEIFGPRPRTAQ